MQDQATHASGHAFCVERKRGPQWYCKFHVGGKQVQKRLGPAWIVGGPPPDGYFTKKTAEAKLAAILTDARRGALPGLPAVGATVRDATEEWLRHGECERGIKASTASEYRNVVEAHIVPRFGDWPVGSVTRRDVAAWQAELLTSDLISRRTVNKILTARPTTRSCAFMEFEAAGRPPKGTSSPVPTGGELMEPPAQNDD